MNESAMVEFLKVYAAVPGRGILLIDAIRDSNGVIWLVPEWIDGYPTKGFSRPARLIRPLWGSYGSLSGHLLLQGTLPIDALSMESLPGYEVALLPNLYVEEGARGLPN